MHTLILESPSLVSILITLSFCAASAVLAATPFDEEKTRSAVESASQAWIAAFNRGDTDTCADTYTEDATFEARPLADLRGREAIRAFWREVMEGDPGTLRYENPNIHVLDADTAVLSSRWSMSRLGRGFITLERWERQQDGIWRLVEDRFEIREQYAKEQTADTPQTAQSADPTFVLVHGAWMGGWAWNGVVEHLQRAGMAVIAPDLPAHGDDCSDSATVTLQDYVDRVVAVIDDIDGDVMLVGHSFGGVVVSQVAEARPERLRGLIYVCAFLLPDGQSFESATAGTKSEALTALVWSDDGGSVTLSPGLVHSAVAHDVPSEAFETIRPLLVAEPSAPLMTPVQLTDARWGSVPRFYVEASLDRALPLTAQQAMAAAAGVVDRARLEASHTPMASLPSELAAALVDFAGR